MNDIIIHLKRAKVNRVSIDLAKLKIDTKVTAIYPVRYAYANFFEESLAEASSPPALGDLLEASTISEGKGYVVRLLRQGWIYIREEDDQENGYFHIFKYEKVERNGELVEQFTKFMFKNKVNAQDGVVVDTSAGKENYPFVFVRRGVREISIVYSEHEWSPEVIDNMNGDASGRAQAMQRVDLMAENDTHSLLATKENIGKLIEDYRERQNRILQIKSDTQDPELKEVSLDVLTTEASYNLDAAYIAEELQKKSAYADSARIVALFDPVGRQKEIAQAHVKLSLWEKEYSSQNMYPFVIGEFVNNLKNKGSEDVKEIAEEFINWPEHKKYWGDLQQDMNDFKTRQEQFAKLYKDFMFGVSFQAEVGSLDTYFKKFFCHPTEKEQIQSELQKLCDVSGEIYAGVLISSPAKKAMEDILYDAANQADIEHSTNAFHIFWDSFVKLVTTPQKGVDWAESIAKFDAIAVNLGPLLSEIAAAGKYNIAKFEANIVRYVVDTLLPAILGVFKMRIVENSHVRLSHNEMGEILAKALDQSLRGKRINAFDYPELKKRWGNKLFDWGKGTRNQKNARVLELFEIVEDQPKVQLATTPRGEKIGLVVESGFAGLSVIMNTLTICSLTFQTKFQQASPLNRGYNAYSSMMYVSAISSLTSDMITLGKNALKYEPISAQAATFARALSPAIKNVTKKIGQLLVQKVGSAIIAIANLFGALASALDAYRALNRGNTGESAGYTMMAVSSGVLFFHALYAMGTAASGTAAASGATAAGTTTAAGTGAAAGGILAALATPIVIGALLLLVIGIGFVIYFSKTPFQTLLENCFWGNGSKYAFWFDRDTRPGIEDRLDDAKRVTVDETIQLFYKMEFQEFINLSLMPLLELDKDSPWFANLRDEKIVYRYKFTLPEFQEGVSDIRYGLVSPDHYDLSSYLRNAINDTSLELVNDAAVLDVKVELPADATLYWIYEPQPNVFAPLRYLTEDGIQTDQVMGMIDEKLV